MLGDVPAGIELWMEPLQGSKGPKAPHWASPAKLIGWFTSVSVYIYGQWQVIPKSESGSSMHGAPQHHDQGVRGKHTADSNVLGFQPNGPKVDTNAPPFIASHISSPPSILSKTQLAPLVPMGKILNVDCFPGVDAGRVDCSQQAQLTYGLPPYKLASTVGLASQFALIQYTQSSASQKYGILDPHKEASSGMMGIGVMEIGSSSPSPSYPDVCFVRAAVTTVTEGAARAAARARIVNFMIM